MVAVQDLDVRGGVDLAGGDGTRAGGAQGHALGAFGVHPHGQLLDIQDDVDDVLTHAFERGELVHDTIDLDGRDGGALQGGQENAAERIAQRHAETALEGLGDDTRLARGVGA